MGQSWGSMLGLTYASRHPDTDKAALLRKDIALFSRARHIDQVDIGSLERMIITSSAYLKGRDELSGLKTMLLGIMSPHFNRLDLKWFFLVTDTARIFEKERPLVNYMYFEFDAYDQIADFEVPLFFIQGSHDYITPTDLVEDYARRVRAPRSELISLDETGHTPFLDKPDEFADLVRRVLGDF